MAPLNCPNACLESAMSQSASAVWSVGSNAANLGVFCVLVRVVVAEIGSVVEGELFCTPDSVDDACWAKYRSKAAIAGW